jgi:hypothetical protein
MIDAQGAQPVAEDRTYRALAWIGVAIQAAALVAVLVVERFGGVPSLASFLVLSVAFLVLQDRLPGLLTFLVIVAAVVDAAGWAFDLYQKFAPFDELVHTFTAFTGMAALGYFGWTQGYIKAAPDGARFVLIVAVGGLVLGVGWELVEVLFLDLTWTDSLVDLLADTVGAAAGGVLAGWAIRRQGRHRMAPRAAA